jgi:uroporphyrinogen-III synthase
MKDQPYEITEKDIESTVRYLEIFHPENANKEYAAEMLMYLKASFHRLALTNPEALEELYTAFEKSKHQ